MAHLIPVPLVAITAVLLVRAELRQEQRQIYAIKPLTTLLVILVAALSFLSPAVEAGFTWWVLAGLVFSLGGDMALMFTSNRSFMVGLIFFLLAHVVYAIGFTLPTASIGRTWQQARCCSPSEWRSISIFGRAWARCGSRCWSMS